MASRHAVQGRTRDIPGLAEALSTKTEHRKELLSAREREILENHLLNEVAGTLHELIAAAEEEVATMNAELESRFRPIGCGPSRCGV